MAQFERKSLSEQLVLRIAKDITAGVWVECLPGYRVLGERYSVSRSTCERATRALEADGLIGPAELGKMRLILKKKKARNRASVKLHLLIVIDSRHPPTPVDAELVTQIESFWKTEGSEITRVTADLMRSNKPEYQLKKWIKMSGADCLLFETMPSGWVMPVEKLGLPCYALGGSLAMSRGILSGSGFKIVQCVENLLRELLELGHRRIMLVMGRATHEENMKNSIKDAIAPILAENWEGEEVAFSSMIPDLANPSDWEEWWRVTLLLQRPTLVLVDSVFQGLSFYAFCLARGIKMPRDISMVVLEDADFLEWLNPSPTRFRYQKEEGFRHFRSWARGGFIQGSTKLIGADRVGGETLGPVPE